MKKSIFFLMGVLPITEHTASSITASSVAREHGEVRHTAVEGTAGSTQVADWRACLLRPETYDFVGLLLMMENAAAAVPACHCPVRTEAGTAAGRAEGGQGHRVARGRVSSFFPFSSECDGSCGCNLVTVT